MRTQLFVLIAAASVVCALPAIGQHPSKLPFKVEFDPVSGVTQEDQTGKKGLHFTVRFNIVRQGKAANEPGKDYKIVIEEDGREVARCDVPEPRLSDELSAVLAIDISGSMERDIQGNKENKKRIDQARIAAESFVMRLPRRADCGLILFDHEIRPNEKVPPSADRTRILGIIKAMQPRGGTAYLDATKTGIAMLANLKSKGLFREKAVVVMTDGVDLNSTVKLDEVIKYAQSSAVKVHTIGIGEPGTGDPVYSVLALDHSQSMDQPADDNDQRPKIEAMHKAASRFVEIMPETARTTVLPFGSVVAAPANLSNDRFQLINKIKGLKPQGETAMLDAAFDAIATVEAANPRGHKAVVVMTDGIDNMSRHRPEDVIQRAKEAKVPVYMLAFGRESELTQAKDDMTRIAKETGGSFHHAKNEKDLIRIFEDMSNALHDDGIDVKSLTRLAKETGGKYHVARDINNLKLILEQLSTELQRKEYAVTFASPRGQDGQARHISIKLVRTSGGGATGEVLDTTEADTAVHGVVVAEMNPFVYLAILGVLGLMLVVPTTFGRMMRSSK